jgi:hypothetical protein
MKKAFSIGIAAVIAAGSLAIAPSATAKDGDIRKEGNCSGSTDWKLKLSEEDGRIEVEFEVDSNVNGQEWRVTLKKDGERIYRRVKTTKGPSGSFEARKVTGDGSGTEHIVGKARNLNSDETCRGAADWK